MNQYRDVAGPPSGSSQVPSQNLFGLAALLLKRWRLVVFAPLGVAAIAGAASYLVTPRYAATVTFTPDRTRETQIPGFLAGLAGQIGLNIGGQANQSPGFYIQVLQSRELLEEVLMSRFLVNGDVADSVAGVPLIDLLNVKGTAEAQRVERGLRRFRRLLSTSADNQTAIIRVTFTSRDAKLSADVANSLIEGLNQFNSRRAQQQARLRRIFIEERLAEARGLLQDAEDDVFVFLETNRIYRGDPLLEATFERLQRQVMLRQESYVTLSRGYEEVRTEELNDVPGITVIDPAVPPWHRSAPWRTMWVLLAFAVAATATLTLTVLMNYVDRWRDANPDEYAQLTGLAHKAWREALFIGSRRRSGT